MALRLTEEEVHTACAEIAAQGERPTALILLDKLGRGSLTTITKYLNSWNASDEAKVLGVESLPAIVELPPGLTKDGESLIKKIWAVAKGIADEELDSQREALKQAEITTQAKRVAPCTARREICHRARSMPRAVPQPESPRERSYQRCHHFAGNGAKHPTRQVCYNSART